MGRFQKSDEHGEWFTFTTYSHPDHDLPDITLLPVSHIAEREFYDELNHEKWFANVFIFEGVWVPFRFILRWLYPVAAVVLGLAPQDKPISNSFERHRSGQFRRPSKGRAREWKSPNGCSCGRCYAAGTRYVWADLDKKEMRALIAKLPLSARLAYPFLAIAFILSSPFILSREEVIAKSDDFDPVEKFDSDSFFGGCMRAYMSIIGGARDAYLQNTLAIEIQSLENQGKHIYVSYGALHMLPLHDLLCEKYGYVIFGTRDVLAIASDQNELQESHDKKKFGYGIAKERWIASAVSETKQPSMDWKKRIKKSSGIAKVAGLTMSFTKAKAVLEVGDSYAVTINAVPKDIVDIYQTIPDDTLDKAS